MAPDLYTPAPPPEPKPAAAPIATAVDSLTAPIPAPEPQQPPAEEAAPDAPNNGDLGNEDAFAIMDRLDEEQVISELSGRARPVADALVYRFKDSRDKAKLVSGLSKRGVDEAARMLAKTGQVIRELKLAVKETETCFLAKALVGRYLVSQDGKELLLETKFGTKRQLKVESTRFGPKEDKFAYEKACAKALRNGMRRLLPEELCFKLIERVLALEPENVRTVGRAAQEHFEEAPEGSESRCDPRLLQRVMIGFRECEIPENERAGILRRTFGVDSATALSNEQAQRLIVQLQTMYRAKKAT